MAENMLHRDWRGRAGAAACRAHRLHQSRYFLRRNGVSSGTLIFLTFFIAKMVGRSDFGDVVHAFGAKLHLHVGAGAVVIERNVKRLVAVDILLADVVPVIRLSVPVQQWRGALFYPICRFDREASLLQKGGKDICNLIQIL